jgi:hypothetical protein
MGELNRITSAAKVTVDEFEFIIEPNSLSYKDGNPSRSVKGTTGGAYYADNYEDAKGMIKFSIPNTQANDKALNQVRRRGQVTVKAEEIGGNWKRVMKAGVSLNDSESSVGSDGMLEETFEGTPLV